MVEYVKKVLEAEGIPAVLVAKDPARANLIARLKGNGSKKALLIVGPQRYGQGGTRRNGRFRPSAPSATAGMFTAAALWMTRAICWPR